MSSPRAFPLLGLFLAVALAFTAAGVEQSRFEVGGLSLRKKTWTTDDDLPINGIRCLKQTSDGYLWLGTYYGLVRFDGNHFRTFDRFTVPEMPSETITSLAEDNQGVLWVGTTDGLLSYNRGKFRRYSEAEGLPDARVWRVAARTAGGVWVQSAEHVLLYQDGAFRSVLDARTIRRGDIIALASGRSNEVNIILQGAWVELRDDGRVRTNYLRSNSEAGWMCGQVEVTSGECWVGSDTGVTRISRGRAEPVPQLGSNRVAFLRLDNSGRIWMNGIVPALGLHENGEWDVFDLGLESIGGLTCHLTDAEGNTWLGTERGLVQLRALPARSYTRRDGLSDDNVWSVCEGTDGTIWLGTSHGLSAVKSDGIARNWRDREPALDLCNRSVWPNRAGGVFIAKESEAIYEFQDGQFSRRMRYRDFPGIPTGLWEDESGQLVLATSTSVLVCRGSEPDAILNQVDSYPVPDARGMAEEKDGTRYFATKGRGLAVLQKGTVRYLTERQGLSNSNVWSIHRAASGALWLATDQGVTRLLNGKLSTVTREQGLLENTVNCIIEDDFGYFWLSGLRAIYRIAASELEAAADGRTRFVSVQPFGTPDGMEISETNGETQPAACKARDGRLWFATIGGVVVIDPRQIIRHEGPPRAVLEEVKANDEVIAGHLTEAQSARGEEEMVQIRAGHGQAVEFRFAVIGFAAPERVRFRWRLQPGDRDWRQEPSQRAATYTNLRPGKYRFELVAGNDHNVWGSPLVFAFHVAPHLWQTAPFYILCGAIAIGMGVALSVYRLRWQRKLLKIEEQTALAVERTRIARDLHDDLGTALTGLALELDVIGRESGGPARLAARLGEAARKARALAERMREVVWTVNPRCDTVSSLADFLEQQASQFLRAPSIMVRLEFPEDIPVLPIGAEARHQLALSVREALNNIVRHAGATEVVLGLSLSEDKLTVQIRDNGRGFHPVYSPGHGLENMRARLEQAGGTFELASRPGAGAVLTFRLPLESRTTPQSLRQAAHRN